MCYSPLFPLFKITKENRGSTDNHSGIIFREVSRFRIVPA